MPPRNPQRALQQQPRREVDAAQQQAGSSDFQPRPQSVKGLYQMGEHSHGSVRQYNQRSSDAPSHADAVQGDKATGARPEHGAGKNGGR